MPPEPEGSPAIVLGSFRFSNPLPSQNQKNLCDKTHGSTTTAPPGGPSGSESRRSEAYEHMATDKPGHELDHDAGIWKLYLEEANQYDQELVRGRQVGLDVLLLLAALFSAILTAFLVESKDMLQQDPGDASVALLLLIAQSQYRMELGIAPNHNGTPPSVPVFTPPTAARWINGIWFTSLGLSLSAALVAMLSKEWLNAFLSSRPRQAHSHALLRQSRLEGLERWWVLHITALLPSILHISLLLFGVGQVIYLWTLDTIVATFFATILGLTSLFYLLTAVLGVMYEFCPFVTQISGYVRRATISWFCRNRTDRDAKSTYPSLKDLQALLWLVNNARDPVIVECAHQALAGLHRPLDAKFSPDQRQNGSKVGPQDQSTPILPLQLTQDITLNTVLRNIIDRFQHLVAGVLHPACDFETSLGRYSDAMLALVDHLHRLPREARIIELSFEESESSVTPSGPQAGVLFSAIEQIWSCDNHHFSPDTYASLLATEMAILEIILDSKRLSGNEVIPDPQPQPAEQTPQHIAIPLVPLALESSRLQDLRYRRDLWLARVSTLLSFYASEQITMETSRLSDLLRSLTRIASYDVLNSSDPATAHHLHAKIPTDRSYRFNVAFDTGDPCSTQSENLCMAPLSCLVRLFLKCSRSGEVPLSTTMLLTGLTAYSAWAPMVLQSMVKIDRKTLDGEFSIDTLRAALSIQQDATGMRFILMRQTLLTIRHLTTGETTLTTHHFHFVNDVLNLMRTCLDQVKNAGSEHSSLSAIAQYRSDLVPIMLGLIKHGDDNLNQLSPANTLFFVNFTHTRVEGLLPDKVEQVLQAMIRRMRRDGSRTQQTHYNSCQSISSTDYLRCFTHGDSALSSLAEVGTRPEYTRFVVAAFCDIVRLTVDYAQEPPLIRSAVPGFLDAMSVSTKYFSDSSDRHNMLFDYSRDILEILGATQDAASISLISKHHALQDLWTALEPLAGHYNGLDVLTKLSGLAERFGINCKDERRTC